MVVIVDDFAKPSRNLLIRNFQWSLLDDFAPGATVLIRSLLFDFEEGIGFGIPHGEQMGHFMQIIHPKEVQHLILLHDPLVPCSIRNLQPLRHHLIDVHDGREFWLDLIQDLLETTRLFQPGIVLLLMDGIMLILEVLPCCQ